MCDLLPCKPPRPRQSEMLAFPPATEKGGGGSKYTFCVTSSHRQNFFLYNYNHIILLPFAIQSSAHRSRAILPFVLPRFDHILLYTWVFPTYKLAYIIILYYKHLDRICYFLLLNERRSVCDRACQIFCTSCFLKECMLGSTLNKRIIF